MRELLALVAQRSRPGNSWEAYAIFLLYLERAQRRLPSRAELADCDDIEAILAIELEHIAVMLDDIFPTEGYEELYSYLLTAQA